MGLEDLILKKTKHLPKSKQNQVIDFIDFISSRNISASNKTENEQWSALSISGAFGDLASEEELYSLEDIKIKYE